MEHIQSWLMGNIWGIVILGAIGSILGSILIITSARILKYLFPKVVDKFKKILSKFLIWLLTKSINDHIKFFFRSSPSKLQAYYLSLKAKLTILLFVASWLLAFSVYTYERSNIWSTVVLTGIFIVVAMISLKTYMTIAAAWLFDIDTKVDNAANDALKQIVEKTFGEIIKERAGEIIEKVIAERANKANSADAKSSAAD